MLEYLELARNRWYLSTNDDESDCAILDQIKEYVGSPLLLLKVKADSFNSAQLEE
jgi:hypothetical protein